MGERESDLEDAMPVLIKGFAQRAGGIVGWQNSSPESCGPTEGMNFLKLNGFALS